jgi:hypothetical protein
VSFADWGARTGASVASAASASSQPTSAERRPNLLPASVDLSHDIARLRELATAVPGAAVVTGYGHVTAALMRLLDAPEEPQAHDAPALARMAADRGLVTDQLVETVQGLAVLKDLGVRGGAGTGLSVEQANEYIDLVGAALYVIYHRKPDVDLASSRPPGVQNAMKHYRSSATDAVVRTCWFPDCCRRPCGSGLGDIGRRGARDRDAAGWRGGLECRRGMPPRLSQSGFRITFGAVEVHPSARKHGVADGDAVHAAGRFLVAYPQADEGQEGPRRELRLGPDRAGNLLEVVVLLLDDGGGTHNPRDAHEAEVPGSPAVITGELS